MQADYRIVSLHPDPENRILAGSKITVTVGVSITPPQAPNIDDIRVKVHYIVNDGSERNEVAKWTKSEKEIDYFETRIDPLWAGDKVEFFVTINPKDVPEDKSIRSNLSSFNVVDARIKRKTRPSRAIDQFRPSISDRIPKSSSIVEKNIRGTDPLQVFPISRFPPIPQKPHVPPNLSNMTSEMMRNVLSAVHIYMRRIEKEAQTSRTRIDNLEQEIAKRNRAFPNNIDDPISKNLKGKLAEERQRMGDIQSQFNIAIDDVNKLRNHFEDVLITKVEPASETEQEILQNIQIELGLLNEYPGKLKGIFDLKPVDITTKIAATLVDPKILSMAGIETDFNDSIEPGYKLRWFCGPEMKYPDQAFPPDPNIVEKFVSGDTNEPIPQFEYESDEPQVQDDSLNRSRAIFKTDDQKNGFNNHGVPPAFLIYRRQHYPHFDHGIEITREILDDLRRIGKALSDFKGIDLSFNLGDLKETLIVKFRKSDKIQGRTVHFLDLSIRARSFDRPPAIHVEVFADGDPEPVPSIELKWKKRGTINPEWIGNVHIVKGHLDGLRLSSRQLLPFRFRFSFMDEDTKIANDPDNPSQGEWVLIQSIPFITYFRSWQAAKEALFPHEIKNRYLDFFGPGVPSGWDAKLDYKYSKLFNRFQQAFVRLKQAINLNKTFLNWSGGKSLTDLRAKPYTFYQLWCMDPIVATLLSQYYSDAPGPRNPRPPDLGSTYDYMVTTAWQQPEQRFLYICQKVSKETTPPMAPVEDLSGVQLDGVSRSGNQILYRAGLKWKPEISISPDYGIYEAPLADVRRGDNPNPEDMRLITHYVDPSPGDLEGEQVVDVPSYVPNSVKPPITDEERSKFTKRQLEALDLERTLQGNDARSLITADMVDAYQEMVETPVDQFFDIPEPENRFNEWLPVDHTGERTAFFDVRPIDLFGRVGEWHGPVACTLKANLPPSEPVDVKTLLKKSDNQGETIVVSWRFGNPQLYNGEPIDHFNILWKIYDPIYDPIGTAEEIVSETYQHFFNRQPSSDALQNYVTVLNNGTLIKRDFLKQICSSEEYWNKNSSPGNPPTQLGFINNLHQDLINRLPCIKESEYWNARLEQITERSEIVGAMLIPQSVPGENRSFQLWQDQMLKAKIPYKRSIPGKVFEEFPWVGSVITGQILDATFSSAEARVSEETSLLGPGKRLITITTDQCFRGSPPFLDHPTRYADSIGLLDKAKLKLPSSTLGQFDEYEVISMEAEDTLRIIFPWEPDTQGSVSSGATPTNASSSLNTFISYLKSGISFSFEFETVKDSFSWDQKLDVEHLPGILEDTQKRTLPLRISSPFSLEITGRKSLFSSRATLEYDAGEKYRIPIENIETISLSADSLRYGNVWIDQTNHRTEKLIISNRGSVSLMITDATTDNNAFMVQAPESPESIKPSSDIAVEVAFNPAYTGNITANLSVMTNYGSFSIPLSGTGVSVKEDEQPDLRLPMPRLFLAELTLAHVIRDLDTDDTSENPAPIFPDHLLQEAISSGVGALGCKICFPPVREIVINSLSAEDASILTTSLGGDLTFVPSSSPDEEYLCEVITRPVSLTGGDQMSFLIRQAQTPPDAPIGPGPSQNCNFHPAYREEINLKSSPLLSELLPNDTKREINIAVSAHRNPQQQGEYLSIDKDNLVSAPAKVIMPAAQPEDPKNITPLEIKDPWEDPFKVDFTSLPKLLDNRKVVQYKLCLDDETLMSDPQPETPTGNETDFEPPEIPANGALEILRVPEDGLRSQILAHLKLPIPSNPQTDPDYQEFIKLTDDQDLIDKLLDPSPTQRFQAGFNIFNQMNDSERYQAIATWLIQFWEHSKYNLKSAFSPVGKIINQNALQFVDELEGIAAGNIFYAVRAIREGASSSKFVLLPFRVKIPDITAPPSPKGFQVLANGDSAILRWRRNDWASLSKYKIYRASAKKDTSNLRGMDEISTFEIVLADQDPKSHYAPLVITNGQRELKSNNGEIDLWFPPDGFRGIEGIYRKDDFVSTKIPLTSQTGQNFFNKNISYYDQSQAKILNVQVPVTNGKNPSLVVVCSVAKTMSTMNPHLVIGDTMLLPRINKILGVFSSETFNEAATPLQNQTSYNYLSGDDQHIGNTIVNIPAFDGEVMSVLFEDQRVGYGALQNLVVENGQLSLPFGSHMLDIEGVYTPDDSDKLNNLLLTGASVDHADGVVKGLSLYDGESLLLDIKVDSSILLLSSNYNAVRLPSSLLGKSIVAVVDAAEYADGIFPDPIPIEKNILPAIYIVTDRTLYFSQTLTYSKSVIIIAEDTPGGNREVVSTIDDTYQYADKPLSEGEWTYRLVAVKEAEKSVGSFSSVPTAAKTIAIESQT